MKPFVISVLIHILLFFAFIALGWNFFIRLVRYSPIGLAIITLFFYSIINIISRIRCYNSAKYKDFAFVFPVIGEISAVFAAFFLYIACFAS